MANSRFKEGYRTKYIEHRDKIWAKKSARVRLHRSFRRSYREDYHRDLEAPGMLHHTFDTLKILFKNWKLFGLLLILIVGLNIFFSGIMSEDTYVKFQETLDKTTESQGVSVGAFARAGLLLISTVTTGGLSQGITEVQGVFVVFFFIVLWLVTIYLVRHLLAGHHPRLRDGLFNALTPFLSTFCVVAIIMVQLIPIMLVIITYSSAQTTGFLETPFYALVYFVFASLMIVLSCYLLSSSVIALVAVSAPGLYPMRAMHIASDLMAGRRIRFILRLLFLFVSALVMWVIVVLPIILLDLWLKSSFEWIKGLPIVPFMLMTMTCFTIIYATTYIYLYYRRVLDYDNKE